jgi:hypothetical protein
MVQKTEEKTDGTKRSPDPTNNWHKEVGVRARFSRPPIDEVRTKLENVEVDYIRLRERGDYADITVRLLTRPAKLFPGLRKRVKKAGLSLGSAFEEVLSKKLDGSGTTARVQFTRTAIAAYRSAWEEFYRSAYIGHSHPDADAYHKRIFNDHIAPVARLHSSRGRSKNAETYLTIIGNKYDFWLSKCEFIHTAAKKVAERWRNDNKPRRKAIWALVEEQIYGMPGTDWIMGGAAFLKIPGRAALLEQPTTWTPRQLAIALIAIKEGSAYETVEKKLRRIKDAQIPPRS